MASHEDTEVVILLFGRYVELASEPGALPGVLVTTTFSVCLDTVIYLNMYLPLEVVLISAACVIGLFMCTEVKIPSFSVKIFRH